MDRTNAMRLVLASGVFGGFIVGWIASSWLASTPAPPLDTSPRLAPGEPVAVATAPRETVAALTDEADAPAPLPADEPETEPTADRDDGADTFTTPTTFTHANEAPPAFSPATTARRRIASGRVNRGIRRLFGLGPSPRRVGGRGVRHVILESPAPAETRRAATGTATAADVRSVAVAARSETPAAPRTFGTIPTLTSGLVDAFGTRTSGLATFDGPPTIKPSPETVAACCLGGASPDCIEMRASDCDSAGGVFLGANATCDQRVVPGIFAGTTDALRLETTTVASCPRAAATLTTMIDGAPAVRIDPWRMISTDGTTCGSYWSAASCVIPANFFGPGSRPFKDRVCLRGAPLGPVVIPEFAGFLDFEDADTLLRRTDDPFDACHAPSPDPVFVGVAVERMMLEGTGPLVVRFEGTDRTEIWSVRVEVTGGSDQPEGLLTAYKEHPNGGRFDATLAFCPSLVFTRFDDPRDVRVLDYCRDCDPEGIVLETIGTSWAGTPGAAIALPNPVPTAFHPGVTDTSVSLDADCNENGFLDSCDIADGISFDRDRNGVPDECECGADLDGSGDVGFGDLAVLLLEWGPCTEDPCFGDLDENGVVEMGDVFQTLRGWGECK